MRPPRRARKRYIKKIEELLLANADLKARWLRSVDNVASMRDELRRLREKELT